MATATRRRSSVLKKINLDLPVDERTKEMSNQALICRRGGHRWVDQALPRRQTLENLKNGIMEYRKACKCGYSISETWSIRERMRVESKARYPKGGEYLMPPGSGRLSRAEAFAASVVREVALIV
jgi:hypothetical protein